MGMDKPNIKKTVDALGGDFEVGLLCGIRPGAVRMWIQDGYVPPKHRETLHREAAKRNLTIGPLDYLEA